ncbi:M13 family metallopeptidase [Vitiosangium sp. GDMCC 1.1324]|uniref:M13 family metallopeptidase n=1 Tax=Vitiosangium sp. (strain GDMCC 1.1324) TaxID=2138576 RepID=UPI000D3CB851|nr:M13 family metallopeptidase [Vitiosangium sp. GDMCC 1.1324]PTL82599.1 M13 family peptidase [Vitiosangium sp. GDMCC 1.1324]
MRKALLAACCLLASACKTAEPAPAQPQSAPAPQPQPVAETKPLPSGLDAAALNEQANPCEDFYEYACGNWVKSAEIPADRPRWSRGFDTIAARNEEILRDILAATSTGKAPEGTPYAQKLGDYYGACMDENQLEASLPVLKAQLAKLTAVKNAKELAQVVGSLHAQHVFPFFQLGSNTDFKDATQVIGEVDQGGLGLPDRDYYLKDDEKSKALRAAYVEHMKNIFGLLGEKPEQAAKSAASVMELETALAKASLSRVDRREPKNVYHRLERKGLKETAPTFPWDVYFTAASAKDVQALNVTHPPFFAEVDRLVKATKPDAWKPYLTWNYVVSVVPALPKSFQDERFRFNAQNLTGAKEDVPRWKKCVRFTNGALGEALAQPFITQTFGAEGKKTTQDMVVEIEKAFERNLDTLTWMDAPTREQALVKVRKIINKIGYPDQWRNYDALKVERGSFLNSFQNAAAFEQARQLAKIGKPVDKAEWLMSPPTVNAYYNPPFNEIVFPAGILQPPFFTREATPAVNFGAMGMVVGHEITHGFDDEGRQYDAEGNLRDWWTQASDKAFRERVACVKAQYDGYTAVDELKVNGALTLGENVADLGGLKLAHAAMEAWLAKEPEVAKQANSYRFTPSQQFFLGYAQSWCSKYRDAFARQMAVVDPHSPPYWRVNGPVVNLPGFQKAFQCKEGAKMVRPAAQRCEVW